MGFFVVPFDYNEETHSSIVPICIADTDSEGNPVNRDWIEHGVVPVADPLRNVAQRLLNDRWRVSEITEHAVHTLSRKHHGSLADEPSRRVLNYVRWFAADLRVGGRRARCKADVELFAAKLQTIPEPYDLVSDLLAKDTLNRLLEALDRQGSHDLHEMASMMLRDCAISEFEERFRTSRNTLSQRFYRGVRRVAGATGIVW